MNAAENNELKLSIEKATKEVRDWLDYKKVSGVKRLKMSENIERLIYAFADGRLVMDEKKVITQTLKFPIGEDEDIPSLRFEPRLQMSDVKKHLVGVMDEDGLGRVFAYVAAATGELTDVVGKLDAEDYHLSADLVVFFMMLN